MKIKEAFDELLSHVSFDKKLNSLVLEQNSYLLTKNENHVNLFGSKLIGCYPVYYTLTDREMFFEYVFQVDSQQVESAINKITTINKEYKVSGDPVQLICFYSSHRYLSNSKLNKNDAIEFSKNILDYVNYRTLIVHVSRYFKYPISMEKAISLTEKLSNKFLIKRLKNWNEYCQYRSSEFLKSKFYNVLVKFDDDNKIIAGINDLYSRTKDTMKNIYRIFLETLNEKDSIIKIKSQIEVNVEGEETLADKTHQYENIIYQVIYKLQNKTDFIDSRIIDITVSAVKNVSPKYINDFFSYMYDYYTSSKSNYENTVNIISKILIDIFKYLNSKDINPLEDSIKTIVNAALGYILFARGEDIDITAIKNEVFKYIKDVFKHANKHITERNINNIRNAFMLYIIILAFKN